MTSHRTVSFFHSQSAILHDPNFERNNFISVGGSYRVHACSTPYADTFAKVLLYFTGKQMN